MRVFTVDIHSICHCNHYSLAYQFVCISESVKSAYGKHFQTTGEENKRACKLCKTKITFDNAKKHSTNLRNHLNRFNPETLQETSAKVPKVTYLRRSIKIQRKVSQFISTGSARLENEDND